MEEVITRSGSSELIYILSWWRLLFVRLWIWFWVALENYVVGFAGGICELRMDVM